MSGLDTITIGERFDYGTHDFTAEEIVRFARKFDPQPFHLDPVAARDSLFGALCASGWHTAAVWMQKHVAHRKAWFDSLRKGGHPVPQFGPALGITDLKWPKPVFADDTVHYFHEFTGKRERRDNREWGIVETVSEGYNQHGDQVISFRNAALLKL